jgi:hypothetical protein
MGVDVLTRRLQAAIAGNLLVLTDVWHGFQRDKMGVLEKQLLVMHAAGAAYVEGVEYALKIGASPFDPVFRLAVFGEDALIQEPEVAFWWLLRPDANISDKGTAAIKTPIQAALAGRSSACIKLLLLADNFRSGFAWFLELQPSLHRLDAGLELVQAAHGRREEKVHRASIKAWLELAEVRLNRIW